LRQAYFMADFAILTPRMPLLKNQSTGLTKT